MSEYVPTTAEVRERFVDGFPMDTWAVSRAACGEEFDRWLADHDRGVRLAYEETRKPDPIHIDNIDGLHAATWLAEHDAQVLEALADRVRADWAPETCPWVGALDDAAAEYRKGAGQ